MSYILLNFEKIYYRRIDLKKRGFGSLLFYALILLGAFLFINSASGGGLFSGGNIESVSYSELVSQIDEGNIASIKVDNGRNATSYVEAILKTSTASEQKGISAYVPMAEFNRFITEYQTESKDSLIVEYAILSEEGWTNILMTISTFAVIGFILFFFLSQQGGGGGGKVMNFGKSKAKLYSKTDKSVTFKQVAGADEEKLELTEVVDFLKSPDRYMKLGARIPKGVLLVGPPGTGKTLLAKATAGEAGVPFFSISGSDFVEMFVGVGASRVRDLFESAKKNAPCIVFIDEIDAVGRHRGAGLGGGNDEREQTLNQLLVEMDGFSDHQGIIVIAATNRADILDPALLRPGRFDRQVVVNVPDVTGREAILNVHANEVNKKPLAKNVDLKVVARATAGFTGADLSNVMNEAALLTARRRKKEISMAELEEAIKRVIAGPEKKSRIITENDKRITAYHETGHAIVATMLKNCDPVHEISVIPRGMAAGYTITLPDNDNSHVSRNKLIDEITCLLGGRAAEDVLLEDICTGASNDIERATNIARRMMTDFGMSKKLGPVAFGGSGSDMFIGRDLMRSKEHSENIASIIDAEIKEIIDTCYEDAKNIILSKKAECETVVKFLYEKESLSGDEFREILDTGTLAPVQEEKKTLNILNFTEEDNNNKSE